MLAIPEIYNFWAQSLKRASLPKDKLSLFKAAIMSTSAAAILKETVLSLLEHLNLTMLIIPQGH